MIYFITQELNKYIKIGYTDNDPDNRSRAMQVGNPHPLNLVAVIDGDKGLERSLHWYFRKDHIRGEV